jgi:DNA excision repair protein ERCC-2
VVGPPLPSFDVEREGMKEYYERRYQQGFNYAYAFPAMAKAVQSAGRVIRTEEDRGLVVLLDGRFMAPDYAGSMPVDWFSETPRELVSSSILEDVRSFWSSGP